jgi:hypothetical protein
MRHYFRADWRIPLVQGRVVYIIAALESDVCRNVSVSTPSTGPDLENNRRLFFQYIPHAKLLGPPAPPQP